MKRTNIVLLTILFVSAMHHSAAAQNETRIAVRAAYIPSITWLCAWVAKDEGFLIAKA